MTPTLETIISAACSKAELAPSTIKNQKIFLIADAKEAKLVFDLLIAYGFEAKLYNEANASRLYVTLRAADAETLAEMHAYASAFLSLKDHVRQIAETPAIAAPAYSLGFSNTPAQDKQFTIHIASGRPIAAPTPFRSPSPSSQQQIIKQQKNAKKTEDIFLGPEIMRPAGRRRSNALNTDGPDSLRRQLELYVKGNSFAAGLILLVCTASLIVVFSMFVMAKTFLCPDFVQVKNKQQPWYCGGKPSEEQHF